jgi:outer membrane receptor protein involved in Fe transport
VNFVNSGGKRLQRGSNLSGIMLGVLRNTPTFDISRGYDDGWDAARDESTYRLSNGNQRSFRAGIYDNPFWSINNNPFTDNVNRLFGHINTVWDPFDWLKISYKLGIDTYYDMRKQVYNKVPGMGEGSIEQQDFHHHLINSDLLFFIKQDIGKKFVLNTTIGHNIYTRKGDYRGTFGSKLAASGFNNISNASNYFSYNIIEEKMVVGLFADIKISLEDYLYLNLSARNDWSSTLPVKDNSFFYPAISLGWIFTENLSVSKNGLFSYGKLRLSWGKVGNDAPLYSTTTSYAQGFIRGDASIRGIPFPAFRVNSFSLDNQLGNPDLSPELTETYEIGGEFNFFNNRIGLDITYYTSLTDGQIMDVDIAPSTGFNVVTKNAGLIENKGLELIIHASPISIHTIKWDMNINFTQYTTFIKEIDETIGKGGIILSGFAGASSNAIAGEPYGVIYGDRYKRIEKGEYAGKLLIGNDGWPLADVESGVVGNPNPDWLMGWRNTFSFKGITLSGLIDIRKGGDMWNGTGGVMNYWGTGAETEKGRLIKGFVFDGLVNIGSVENPEYIKNSVPVDFFNPDDGLENNKWTRYGFIWTENDMEDASWIRLRELSLSYTFSKNLMQKIGMESLTFSLVGRNLWLKTNYTGIDPEANFTGVTNGFGLEYFGMPNTKNYGIKIKIDF